MAELVTVSCATLAVLAVNVPTIVALDWTCRLVAAVRRPATCKVPAVTVPSGMPLPPLGGVIVKWSPDMLAVVPPAQIIWLTTVGL